MDHYFTRLQNAIKSYWDKTALCNYEGEAFTFCQIATKIEKFHIMFQNSGIKKGDRVAICARNSARWGISFLSSFTYETVTVPILADFNPENVNALVDHSESIVLFTDEDIWKKLDINKMPKVRVVVNVSNFALLYCSDDQVKNAYVGLDAAFSTKFPMGFSREDVSYDTNNWEDLAIINYTSGTSSAPKGVMLPYRCLCATIDYGQRRIPSSPNYTMVSMLPMAHMYGLAYEFLYPLCNGTSITFLGKTPSPSTLLKAMHDVKPYQIITVPLVMEKVFNSSIKPVLEKPIIKVLLLIPGVNRLLLNKIKDGIINAFGGQIQNFIMGGAPVNPEIEKWFRRMHLPYTIGYGMTEAAPLLGYEDWDKFAMGSCGKAVDCADVKIDSEDPHNIPGEILAKGINICTGYYKNPVATANAFNEDGYLRTGDMGIVDIEGNIFIKGRCKSMFLSANGQNIYPEEIEAVVNNQHFVVESVVVERASKIVALVYLDQEAIKKAGLDAEAISDIPEHIRMASNKHLNNYSQIVKVEVQKEPFEKTPKFSIKRYLYK